MIISDIRHISDLFERSVSDYQNDAKRAASRFLLGGIFDNFRRILGKREKRRGNEGDADTLICNSVYKRPGAVIYSVEVASQMNRTFS